MSEATSTRPATGATSKSDISKLEGRYMAFLLAGEEYGIGILKVREIIGMQDHTPIPCMPNYVTGVINLRGRIIPLIDLRLKLGLEVGEMTRETCTLVTEIDCGGEGDLLQVGCIVDAVSEVIELSEEQLEPPPRLGASVDVSFMTGLGKIGDTGKVVTLINIDSILADLLAQPGFPEQGGL